MILIFNGCFLNFTFYLYGSDDIFQIYIFCLSNAMQAVYKLVFIYLVLNYMFFLNKSHCKNREIEKQKIALSKQLTDKLVHRYFKQIYL